MRYIKWACQAIASFAISILSWVIINRVLALFEDGAGNLRFGAKYWQTFDNDLYAAQRWREQDILSGNASNPTWREFIAFPLTWWHKYLNRKNWLQRNCCYGWSYYAFGVAWDKSKWTVTHYENTTERTLFKAISSDGHFNIYYHGKYGMLKIGWKAWNMHQVIDGVASFTDDNGMGGNGRIPHVFSYNPLKRK